MTTRDSRQMDPGIKLLAFFSVLLFVGAILSVAAIGARPARHICVEGIDGPECENAAIFRQHGRPAAKSAADSAIPPEIGPPDGAAVDPWVASPEPILQPRSAPFPGSLR